MMGLITMKFLIVNEEILLPITHTARMNPNITLQKEITLKKKMYHADCLTIFIFYIKALGFLKVSSVKKKKNHLGQSIVKSFLSSTIKTLMESTE